MMELKRKHYLVAAVVGGVAFGLFVGLADRSRHADMGARPAATPASSGAPTRDELRHVVAMIFARRAAGSAGGAQMPLSPALIGDKVTFGRFLEIAGARDVRPRVGDVRGRDADLVIRYALVSDARVEMLFVRRDTWRFVPGNGGWQLDGISVNDKVFEGLVFPDGSREKVADSRFDPASGSVTFAMRGRTYVWTPDARWGWKIVALSTPKPAATTIARTTPVPSSSPAELVAAPSPVITVSAQPRSPRSPVPAGRSSPAHAPAVVRKAPAPVVVAHAARVVATRSPAANVAARAYDVCSTETIDSVSEDGSVVTLADGRRYEVRESERYISSLWIAADDVTLCDPGPGMNAKLTHRGDVVYAGHLE